MVRVLVIGESCYDKFIYCHSDRLSPEAPVPIINPVTIVENPGMSGNVVRNLISLNETLQIDHWTQKSIVQKIRYVDKKSNHMFIRVDDGDKNIETFNFTREKKNSLSDYDIVIVSDYNKGFIKFEDLFEIGKNSKLSILDTKRTINNKIVKAFSFIKLNEKEYDNNKHIKDLSNVIITLGANGTKFKNKVYPVQKPRETIDVSGAGDTFTASFILKFNQNKNVEESIDFANKMASIVVSKKGVSVPN
jgi:D-beta-D-heptose 7-phosphate kinase/D-beta-D-heptose 1-phosphate adenosyltransferase